MTAYEPLLEALASALETETRHAIELRHALERQRAAVAANDPDAVDASGEEVGRALQAMEESRRLRLERLAVLAERVPAPETDVPLPARLESARAGLREAASAVAREARINRAVLERTLEAGDAFLQRLFTAREGPEACYAPHRTAPAAGAVLLDRRV